MTEQSRYSLIDALRGAAVISMLLYHLLFDIFYVFGVWREFYLAAPVVIWERSISATFIVTSGICVNFAKRGYRRALIILLCALAVTLSTRLITPDYVIWFGVLHFLGVAMLLTVALRRWLDRMEPLFGMTVFFFLFMLCYGIPEGFLGLFSLQLIRLPEALYQSQWAAFIGFCPTDYFSADYFPILRWIFLYLFGYQLWRYLTRRGRDRFFLRQIPVLDFFGRHSLIIYLLHQPVLYGICWLFFSSGK